MWYPPQQQHQQQHCWHGYIHQLSPPKQQQQQQQQQQQTYSRTSYYCNIDEPLNTNRATTYVLPRHDENESLIHYQATRVDDVYVTGSDHYVTTSPGSYTDEMSASSLSYQTSNTHWNPVIAAPTKTSVILNSIHQNDIHTIKTSSSSSSSDCWDWLLYSPEIYSHLYIPSSSFVQQQQQDDDLDLLASLPTWLLALLYPSMKQIHTTDNENDNDQEISSLSNNNNNNDEPLLSMNIDKKINHVSSNLSLSSENTINGQKTKQNRSSTPDTDDGYQSASDASRSDYSQQSSLHYDHHNSKDDIIINVPSSLMPKRISYAAAVKPMTAPMNNNNKISSSPILINKMKSNSSSLTTNEMLNNNNNGQKSKFIAPRFERMHHAKQYSSSTTTTTTMTNKDSSSSSTLLTNRAQIRSNNNHNQRNHINNSSRRR